MTASKLQKKTIGIAKTRTIRGTKGRFARASSNRWLAHADFTLHSTSAFSMAIRLFVADNAIDQHSAARLTAMNVRRDAAGHHGERGGLRVGPRQRRDINLMRMPVDVHVHELPPVANGAEYLVGDPLEIELVGCLWTIDGDDRLRFGELMHLPHAQQPTATATTATSGIQTRANTFLVVKRGLTRITFRHPISTS